MPLLSVVIITFNEENNIFRCIQSVQDIADEILVVDSGSTDATVAICRTNGVHVVQQSFLGYIEQKNFATGRARHDWILALDADEALSPALQNTIREVLKNPRAKGFTMNRLTNYCGRWVRHGGWYPDVKLRLYDRTAGTWSGTNPHDRYRLSGNEKPAHLEGDLLHYSYNTISDHIAQIDRFSKIGAKALYEQGVKGSLSKIMYKPFARFFRNYFLWRGFQDGLTGFIISINSAHAVFLKYLRLYYLQKGKTL